MDWDNLFAQYIAALNLSDKNAAHHKINAITKQIASHLPGDYPEKLAWFIAALQDENKKWFVAKIMEKVNPVPNALLEDLVLAAMLEPNPSLNKLFILPCVKTFDKEKIKTIMLKFSTHPGVMENEGFEKVAYWVGF